MANKKVSPAYDGGSIEVLEGLDPVKVRPGMYTDTSSPLHLGFEVIDNSVDEALSGFASRIEVTLHQDGSLEVIDNGRGMPVDLHPTLKVPAIKLIFERLHAGGKFSGRNYEFSGGLHGVGVSVVNALSSRLQATVKRGGKIWQIEYADGVQSVALHEAGTCLKKDTGTGVRFWPNPKYFDHHDFNQSKLKHALKAKALLCPGLNVSFTDEKTNEHLEWHHEGDVGLYIEQNLNQLQRLPDPPYTLSVKNDELALDLALVWCPEAQPEQLVRESFVNLIPTSEGGTHVAGLRAGLVAAVREFCDYHKLLPRGLRLAPEDVWRQCCFVLALKMHDPQFAGQTKEKLSSRRAAQLVETLVRDRLSLYLNSEVSIGKKIAAGIIDTAKKRESAVKPVLRKRAARGPALPGKLVDCISTDPKCGELFIVEGDSAGGSARQARDASFQAILPLRGKILNTWEVPIDKALKSEEIRAIAVAVGLEPDSGSLDGLRYSKICILADADADGLHIGTLLCALFMRHFPALVRAGHVYVACPPLYRLDAGKYKDYALDDVELEHKKKQFMRKGIKLENIKIQRFKGLGEMNPEQLRETALAPKTRRLLQLTVDADNEDETKAKLDLMLSKKRAADRRSWLQQKGDQAVYLD